MRNFDSCYTATAAAATLQWLIDFEEEGHIAVRE
jgi:hypothetical protein